MDTQQVRVSEPGEFMTSPQIEVCGTEGQGRGGWGEDMGRGQELLTSSVGWRAALRPARKKAWLSSPAELTEAVDPS